MDNKGRIKRMFPGSNTAEGFHSFFDYITGDDYHLRIIIKGGPGSGKSTLMTGIKKQAIDNGLDIVEFHCPTDPDSLDALFIPKLKIALLDGTKPHAIEPRNPGITDDIIWLGEYWDENQLLQHKEKILELNNKGSKLFNLGFSRLKEASIAYDEWRSYIDEGFNPIYYHDLVREAMAKLFSDGKWSKDKKGKSSHYFATAIGGKGVYSYVEELIDSEFQVLAFKGMPGSGAKKAISRIALEADGLGLDTQQYHCPFDVDELEMLIIPHLKRVIVHTSPRLQNHDLVFSSNQKVAFIDFDQGLNLESIYEFDEEIKDTKKRFNDLIDGAVAFIARAKATHGKVEKYYINAMDFHKVNSKKMEILERIFGDSKNKT